MNIGLFQFHVANKQRHDLEQRQQVCITCVRPFEFLDFGVEGSDGLLADFSVNGEHQTPELIQWRSTHTLQGPTSAFVFPKYIIQPFIDFTHKGV
ncbi:hypothetical protein ES703_124229 [subsurface metagenome]